MKWVVYLKDADGKDDKERWAMPSIFVTRRFTATEMEGLCPLCSGCVFYDNEKKCLI